MKSEKFTWLRRTARKAEWDMPSRLIPHYSVRKSKLMTARRATGNGHVRERPWTVLNWRSQGFFRENPIYVFLALTTVPILPLTLFIQERCLPLLKRELTEFPQLVFRSATFPTVPIF